MFLGALATWVGTCTFGSKYAQGWAAYAFVLSGYTVAIVGIPGALEPGNAFYAVARATEVSLGIITTATVAHLILPEPIATSLRQIIAGLRLKLGDYTMGVLHAGGQRRSRWSCSGRWLRSRSCAARRFSKTGKFAPRATA